MKSHDLSQILIGGVEKVRIQIVEYNPQWEHIFGRHDEVIRRALGETALAVEHIGSTAVPGMLAKPIVDILLVVADANEERVYLPQLQAAGYELRVRDPADEGHRMLRTPNRDTHIHVYPKGSSAIQRYLSLRDTLRAREDARRLYSDTKRALAVQNWPDMNAYADAKTAVIRQILAFGRDSR